MELDGVVNVALKNVVTKRGETRRDDGNFFFDGDNSSVERREERERGRIRRNCGRGAQVGGRPNLMTSWA